MTYIQITKVKKNEGGRRVMQREKEREREKVLLTLTTSLIFRMMVENLRFWISSHK